MNKGHFSSVFNILFATSLLLCCITSLADTASTSVNENSITDTVKEETTAENIISESIVTNSSWEDKQRTTEVYENPYRVSLFDAANGEDSERLWSQTKSMAWYGVGVAGFLAILPSDITNWETSDERLLEKWWDNVREGPVWDRDIWYINYVGHPYFGGVYYQAARKSGYRQWDAFVYSALMSTFYWEYGIEAFAEVPALQDLVVTPVLGWVYGEWAFNKEREIIQSGGMVLGSKVLGDTALFFLDPVDSIGSGINNLFGKELVKAGTGYMSFNDRELPSGNTETQFSIKLRYALGDGGSLSESAQHSSYYATGSEDPVDFGIVGFSAGYAYLNLDDEWGVQDGWAPTFSLGLYFSPQLSSRLNYTRGEMTETIGTDKITYENYSVDVQYYFNAEHDFRPYINVGAGEALQNLDNDIKTFQVNAGLGLYYKLNKNWALQVDWQHYYGTKFSANDDITKGQIVYRFGRGER